MGHRVLIAEDEPHLVESLTFILEREGYDIETAHDGETALRRLLASRPDLVILDVMLPGRSGFDILRDIRSREETEKLPVMMLTARGQAKDREMALRLGADRFMTKPFSNAEIVEHVRAMMGP